MVVTCLSDGVQVEIHITEKGFNGVLYVKGHSKNEQCRRVVSMAQDSSPKTEIFKVNFGNCGLIHINVSSVINFNFNLTLQFRYNLFLFIGPSEFCIGHSKTSQTGYIQSSSVSHTMRVQHGRTKRHAGLQRFNVDHGGYHSEHWTATDVFDENCHSHRTRNRLGRDW